MSKKTKRLDIIYDLQEKAWDFIVDQKSISSQDEICKLKPCPALYFVVRNHFDEKDVLYVGMSINIKKRFESHKMRKTIGENDLHYLYYDENSIGEMAIDEAVFISLFAPINNRIVSRAYMDFDDNENLCNT